MRNTYLYDSPMHQNDKLSQAFGFKFLECWSGWRKGIFSINSPSKNKFKKSSKSSVIWMSLIIHFGTWGWVYHWWGLNCILGPFLVEWEQQFEIFLLRPPSLFHFPFRILYFFTTPIPLSFSLVCEFTLFVSNKKTTPNLGLFASTFLGSYGYLLCVPST